MENLSRILHRKEKWNRLRCLFKSGLLKLGAIEFLNQMTVCCGELSWHCRMFSNIPSTHKKPTAHSPTPATMTIQSISKYFHMSHGRQNYPLAENWFQLFEILGKKNTQSFPSHETAYILIPKLNKRSLKGKRLY